MTTEKILKKGQVCAGKVIFAVLVFAILKGIFGFLSSSVALLSDALHSISDAFEGFFVWLGFKISKRKPTEKFPYGFYKAESLTALFVSFLIILAGFEILKESFQRIFIFRSLRIPQIAVIVAILDAIFLFLLGKYELRIGKEINSQSLINQGRELKLHIISSSLVVIGILSSSFGIPKVEGSVGILLSLFVFKVGIESLKDSIFSLMDVSPSKEIERNIKKILKSFPNVEEFSDLKLRKSGPFIFGEAKIKVKKFVPVEKVHEITDDIERKIKNEISQVDSFLLHPEPFKEKEQKIALPVDNKENKNSKISATLSRANFFAFLKVKEKNIESIEFKENPYKEKKIRAGLAVGNFLLKEKIDVLITKEIGPISLHFLRDNFIEIYQTKENTISKTLQKFFEGKLKILKKATRKKL